MIMSTTLLEMIQSISTSLITYDKALRQLDNEGRGGQPTHYNTRFQLLQLHMDVYVHEQISDSIYICIICKLCSMSK